MATEEVRPLLDDSDPGEDDKQEEHAAPQNGHKKTNKKKHKKKNINLEQHKEDSQSSVVTSELGEDYSVTSEFNRKFSLDHKDKTTKNHDNDNSEHINIERADPMNTIHRAIRNYITTRKSLRFILELQTAGVVTMAFLLIMVVGVLFPRPVEYHVVDVKVTKPYFGTGTANFGMGLNVTWQVSNQNNFPLVCRGINVDFYYGVMRVGNISESGFAYDAPSGGRSINVTLPLDIYIDSSTIINSLFNNSLAQHMMIIMLQNLANDLLQGQIKLLANGTMEVVILGIDVIMYEKISTAINFAGLNYPPIPPLPPIPPIPPITTPTPRPTPTPTHIHTPTPTHLTLPEGTPGPLPLTMTM